MANTVIEARRRMRWDLGKNASRRLRVKGWIPAIVYGKGVDPLSLMVETVTVDRILHDSAARAQLCVLQTDDKNQREVLIRDYQLDPIRSELIHVDFLQVDPTKQIQVKVNVELTGLPIGVKTFGGLLTQLVRHLPVECLPSDIPAAIQVDVTHLNLGDSVKVKDLPSNPKVKVLLEPEINLAHVESTRAAVSKTTEEETAAAAAPKA